MESEGRRREPATPEMLYLWEPEWRKRFVDWDAAVAAPPASLGALLAELGGGFVYQGVTVIALADLTGVRIRNGDARRATERLPLGELGLQLGDAVIHFDHGMGVLCGLETVETAESAAGSSSSATLEIRVCSRRYGAEGPGVALDRLSGEAWPKRRAEVEQQIAQTARSLVELAGNREMAGAPVLPPPRREYARFAARFPFTETEDQGRAIEATLQDLASGKPMDRLVCGDVGFGKTEVALRAAAAAVFAGKQVAVVAPTTVLVRQHSQTFRRRFAGFDVRIEALSRL
jgi:transcription-repair coupling factor (superfamily II helicase)